MRVWKLSFHSLNLNKNKSGGCDIHFLFILYYANTYI